MKTILLVDDDALIRGIGHDALTILGYRARTAADGQEALAASAEAPSLVILDDHLPDMPGTAVLRALRTQRPDLPVVLSSGSPSADPTQRLREGWTAVLNKPYSLGELADLLARLLGDTGEVKDGFSE